MPLKKPPSVLRMSALLVLSLSMFVSVLMMHGDARAQIISLSYRAHHAMGGPEHDHRLQQMEADDAVRKLRIKQAVLSRREELLRYQLRLLEQERLRMGSSEDERLLESLRESRDELLMLLKDQQSVDRSVADYLRQMWDAEQQAKAISSQIQAPKKIFINWPVEPRRGLSAHFHDKEYEKFFGIPHKAIDIPVAQNSEIVSAGDGKVKKIADNGMGYSYVIIDHGGYVTLYGHITQFLVSEGMSVKEGQPIALSGGRPGTRGAGPISTGPHLHFELIVDGKHIDPKPYLPYRRQLHVKPTL